MASVTGISQSADLSQEQLVDGANAEDTFGYLGQKVDSVLRFGVGQSLKQ